MRVVLVATRNPLNIGAAARAMSNFGFNQLRLVGPYEPSFREARSAAGAADLLRGSKAYVSVAEAIADCSLVVGTTSLGSRKPKHALRSLEQSVIKIREQLRFSRVALLFGSEKRGLSNDDLSYCDQLLYIPTHEEHSSMNLGQSVAICLYELIRDDSGGKGTECQDQNLQRVTAAKLELLTSVLADILRECGYLKSGGSSEETRRLVRRMRLNERDAETWLGVLRQVSWKLRSNQHL